MPDAVALMGVFLFWASTVWLPMMIYRALNSTGKPQIWQISAILSYGLMLMGYTRAIVQGSVMEAFAWSVAWVVPIGITLFVRGAGDVPLKGWDKWLGAAVIVSFLPAVGVLPGLLQTLARALW